MPIITLFSAAFCGKQPVLDRLIAETGYRHVSDDEVVAKVAAVSGLAAHKIRRAFSAKPSVFNEFTHEKESSIAHMRLVVAEMLSAEKLIVDGFAGHLIPLTIDHVLRVCLVADRPYRVEKAIGSGVSTENDARKLIQKNDRDAAAWVDALFAKQDPWDEELYDIIIPMNQSGTRQAHAVISENLHNDALRKTNRSEKARQDFLLASRVAAVLFKAGHDVTVDADDGHVTMSINKHVLMLARLEKELRQIAERLPGVESVETRVGRGFHKAGMYRKHRFEVPARVLLVDDEREFVQTLSERLQLRDMGSAIVYDGNSALEIIAEDDPEVIIVDLKMPDVNGIDVLRQVKKQRPEIEVIVLTGHGSEADKKECMELGAFDYLQKPVDINQLSERLQKAHDRIRENRGQLEG